MKPAASFPARLALAAFLLSGSGAMGVVPSGATSDQVTWVRDPVAAEPAGRLGLRVPCGAYGVFHFLLEGSTPPPGGAGLLGVPYQHSIDPADLCKNQDPGCESGQEVPPRYALVNVVAVPMSAQQPMPVQGSGSLSGLDGGKRGRLARATGRLKDAWVPCVGGVCYDRVAPALPLPGRPWIAVIDWDDHHGWSVGWTIREQVGTGHDLVLFPFLTPALQAFSGKGVTDVHTLAKLCEISDAVDQGLAVPPTAVNMSFGRFTRPGLDADRGALCTGSILSCQIVRLLEHLYRPPTASTRGTALVAAAGNYRSLQFPASAQAVIPAGGLDLNAFLNQRANLATWETAPELASAPLRARGLLPASGVCLEATPGVAGSPSWAAPPGTSYSSAILTGMLSVELLAGTVADPLLPEAWGLNRVCTVAGVCAYSLQQGPQRAFPSRPGSNLFLSRLFEPRGRECGVDTPQGEGIAEGVVAPALVADPTQSAKSFLQSLTGWDLPSPDANPCIPCAGARQPPPKAMRLSGVDALTAAPVTTSPQAPLPSDQGTPIDVDATPKDWWIDFSESGTFGEGTRLDAIFLRTGTEFRRVSLPLTAMDLLRGGKLDGLYLRGAGSYVNGNRQASLVFLVTSGVAESFWTSIPVYFQ